jgi:hypothetical protein
MKILSIRHSRSKQEKTPLSNTESDAVEWRQCDVEEAFMLPVGKAPSLECLDNHQHCVLQALDRAQE